MIYIPFTTNPVGWAILGVGGYLLYKQGKKKGEEEAAASQIMAIPEKTDNKKDEKGGK